jgi:hypothetical protein
MRHASARGATGETLARALLQRAVMTKLCSWLVGAALSTLALGGGCTADTAPSDERLAEIASASRGETLDIGPDLEAIPAWPPERVAELRRDVVEHHRGLLTQRGEILELEGKLDTEDSDGHPALHYAVLQLGEPHQAAALTQLGLHVDMEPLFGEEHAVTERAHLAIPSGDGHGVLAFVIMPAVTFELLLDARADGADIFDWMLLRELPREDARDGADPSRFRWDYLAHAGLEWHPLPEERTPSLDERETLELMPWLDALERVAAGQADAIGSATEAFTPRSIRNIDVTVEIVPLETDSTFVNQTGDWHMVRAWGNGRGGRVDLRGMPIIAKPTSTAFKHRGELDSNNRAHLSLDDDRSYQICVELDTPGGKIRELPPFSVNICATGTINPGPTTSFVARVQHTYMTMLVQASEGSRWLEEIAGYDHMHKAKVLVGPYADLVAGPVAYAPCASLFKARWVPGVGDLAAIVYHHDVVMPGPRTDAFNRSRAGFSHEWGHVVLCNLIYRASDVDTPHPPPASTQFDDQYKRRFEWAWQDMIIQTAASPSIAKEAVWINEGFADFIASQVAGATNYHDPFHDFVTPFSGMHMCDASFDDCLEENEAFPAGFVAPSGSSSSGFDEALAAFVSLLHDVVDGQLPASGAGTFNNGAAWKLQVPGSQSGGIQVGAFDAPRQNDEVSRLSSGGLFKVVLRWIQRSGNSPTLRKSTFLPAIADALREQGLAEAQICRLFDLHLSSGDCLDVGGGVDLGLDPTEVAQDEGDMLAPAGLSCRFPTQTLLTCKWEDASLDGYLHTITVRDAVTNVLVDEIERPFAIYATASMSLVEHPEITSVRVSIRTRQQGGDLGPLVTATFPRP